MGNYTNNFFTGAIFTREIYAVTLDSVCVTFNGNDPVQNVFATVAEKDNIINCRHLFKWRQSNFILPVAK
jgi:hypothetical protein